MKNYFMRLIILNSVFISCNINAMEEKPLSLLEQSLDFFNDVKKFEIRTIFDNRILIIGKFKTSEEMVEEIQKIALDLHIKTDKSILLCPNMESDNIGKRYVTVKRYTKISDGKGNYYPIPIEGGNTYYEGSIGILSDSRLLTKSQLIIYLLHNKALKVISKIGDKSSIENSKEKHMRELPFMFNKNNKTAPVIVCVNQNCFLKEKIEGVCQAFQDGNVEKFFNYIQCIEEENETTSKDDAKKSTIQNTTIPLGTSKPSFLNSLKFFVFPLALLLIGVSYHYYYKK